MLRRELSVTVAQSEQWALYRKDITVAYQVVPARSHESSPRRVQATRSILADCTAGWRSAEYGWGIGCWTSATLQTAECFANIQVRVMLLTED